jgi:mono/diheme cytochrome c family protein
MGGQKMTTISGWKLWSISLLVGALVAAASYVDAADKGSVAWGKELFRNYCAPCHGEQGVGNGPAANSLKTAPSDLTLISKTHEGHFPREWVEGFIDGSAATMGSHGKREMPIWGQVFAQNSVLGPAGAQAAINALTDYIETIQKP